MTLYLLRKSPSSDVYVESSSVLLMMYSDRMILLIQSTAGNLCQ